MSNAPSAEGPEVPALTISIDQLAERNAWEDLLKRRKCELHEALFMCLRSGAPASEYLIARLEQAIDDYLDGKHEDLAEPFGLTLAKREKNAQKVETLRSHVKFHVDHYHSQGYPKQDPSGWEGDATAFHMAAKMIELSPSRLFELYYERDLKRKARRKPLG